MNIAPYSDEYRSTITRHSYMCTHRRLGSSSGAAPDNCMAARRPSTRRLRLLLQLAEALDALIYEAVHNTGEEGGSPSGESSEPKEAESAESAEPKEAESGENTAEVAESAEPKEESPVASDRPLKRQRTTADDPPSQGSTGSTQPWG